MIDRLFQEDEYGSRSSAAPADSASDTMYVIMQVHEVVEVCIVCDTDADEIFGDCIDDFLLV